MFRTIISYFAEDCAGRVCFAQLFARFAENCAGRVCLAQLFALSAENCAKHPVFAHIFVRGAGSAALRCRGHGILVQVVWYLGAGGMVSGCRWYGIWVQVVWYLGVGGLMIWCRCQGFLVQVSGHFGAGVTLGGRPAPFHGPQAHFAAQVPYLKTHLRQKVVPPAPKGCTSCAKKQDRPVQGYEAVPFLCERLAPPGHGQGPLDTGRARWIQVPSSGTQETTGGAGVEQSGTESSGRVSPFLLGSARRRDHYPGFLLPATC